MKRVIGLLFIAVVFVVLGNASDKIKKKEVAKEVIVKVKAPVILEPTFTRCEEEEKEASKVVELCNHETKTVVYKTACEGSCGFPVSVRKSKINCSKESI